MYKYTFVLVVILAVAWGQPIPAEDESKTLNLNAPYDVAEAGASAITSITQGGVSAISGAAQSGISAISNAAQSGISKLANAAQTDADIATGAIKLGEAGFSSVVGSAAEAIKKPIEAIQKPFLEVVSGESNKIEKPSVGQILDRLGEAVKLTAIEERDSLFKALQAIKEASGKSIKAGMNAAQTGFDIFLVVPKFAVNAFATAGGAKAIQ